jgi:hypothetical protein
MRPPEECSRCQSKNATAGGINALKHHRSFATRYDNLAVRYAATIHTAVIDHWLRRRT